VRGFCLRTIETRAETRFLGSVGGGEEEKKREKRARVFWSLSWAFRGMR
jgi:hypothetical protein